MEYNLDVIRRQGEELYRQRQREAELEAQAQQIVQLSDEQLVDFPTELHKFKAADGQRLKDLEESIRTTGIINALLVRPVAEGKYQIIAGHNRRRAARKIGYQTFPCIIRRLEDDEALHMLINDNLHNRELLPSERGWAYRQELELRKRQGQRSDLTSSQFETKLQNGRSDVELGELVGKSKDHIRRYIRLTYLIQELLNLVDVGKLGLAVGGHLSYLSQRSQYTVYDYCYQSGPEKMLKEAQAKALREIEADPDQIIDAETLDNLLLPQPKVRFRTLKLPMSELRDYFPAGTPEQVAVQTIKTALALYFGGKEAAGNA